MLTENQPCESHEPLLYSLATGGRWPVSPSSLAWCWPGFGVHVADNGLTTGFYGHLADRDALFAASTVSVKRLQQLRNYLCPWIAFFSSSLRALRHVRVCRICQRRIVAFCKPTDKVVSTRSVASAAPNSL